MSSTLAPAATCTDAAEAPEGPALHPDFVMPVPAPYDADCPRASLAAAAWWCDEIGAQARRAYPADEQWLQRACYPGPVPGVPLAQYDGSLWPPVLLERLHELRRAARFFPPAESS
ncbi:hypothetical protein ACIRBX_00255 [Kitasatospora sp. NPDC096147]|uniref:hypothetical protein n=1 Tax=Kitasatospora sp. NPDC096147 TaxID=3364093 RepID=UPI003825ADC6